MPEDASLPNDASPTEDVSLMEATSRHGDELVTLEEYARIAGINPSTLTTYRSRGHVPAPVNPGERPLRYRFRDLAESSRVKRLPSADVGRDGPVGPVSAWSLRRTVGACVSASRSGDRPHSVQRTQLLLAGLLVIARDTAFAPLLDHFAEERPSPGDAGSSPDSRSRAYLRFLRDFRSAAATAARRSRDSIDAELLTELLDGGHTPGAPPPIHDDPEPAVRLVEDLLRRRSEAERHAFAEEAERLMLGLSVDSSEISHRTDDTLAALLLAVAPPAPGGRVLDPACGFGSVLVAAAQRLGPAAYDGVLLIGRDRDEHAWLVAKARLAARRLPHDLGPAGFDSLEDVGLGAGSYRTVIAEPGLGLWEARDWLSTAAGWLAPGGTAAVELPEKTLERGKEAKEIEPHLSAVVVTPKRIRPGTSERMAIWVLRTTPPDEVLVIDLSDDKRRNHHAQPLGEDEIDAVGAMLAAHHGGGDPAEAPGAERITAWLVDRADIVAKGVLAARRSQPSITGSAVSVADIRKNLKRAEKLVEELGELIGTDDDQVDKPLARFVTKETRRAVRRLTKQLEDALKDIPPT